MSIQNHWIFRGISGNPAFLLKRPHGTGGPAVRLFMDRRSGLLTLRILDRRSNTLLIWYWPAKSLVISPPSFSSNLLMFGSEFEPKADEWPREMERPIAWAFLWPLINWLVLAMRSFFLSKKSLVDRPPAMYWWRGSILKKVYFSPKDCKAGPRVNLVMCSSRTTKIFVVHSQCLYSRPNTSYSK